MYKILYPQCDFHGLVVLSRPTMAKSRPNAISRASRCHVFPFVTHLLTRACTIAHGANYVLGLHGYILRTCTYYICARVRVKVLCKAACG